MFFFIYSINSVFPFKNKQSDYCALSLYVTLPSKSPVNYECKEKWNPRAFSALREKTKC